jgi:hypothetical protein
LRGTAAKRLAVKKRFEQTRSMKIIAGILLAGAVCIASSFGGEIYGTIKEGDKPVKKGVTVTVKPVGKEGPNPTPDKPSETDDYGNYRVVVPETGKCTITVTFDKQSISADVQSYSTPVRFDWVLEKTGATYTLKRQ